MGCNGEDARSTEAWQLLFIMCGAIGRDVAANRYISYYFKCYQAISLYLNHVVAFI